MSSDREQRGLLPRQFEYVFAQIESFEEVEITCSYCEIYNEQIFDLLDPMQPKLTIREDSKKGVILENEKS